MSVHLVPILAYANIIEVFEHCDPVGQTITAGLAIVSDVGLLHCPTPRWHAVLNKRLRDT